MQKHKPTVICCDPLPPFSHIPPSFVYGHQYKQYNLSMCVTALYCNLLGLVCVHVFVKGNLYKKKKKLPCNDVSMYASVSAEGAWVKKPF